MVNTVGPHGGPYVSSARRRSRSFQLSTAFRANAGDVAGEIVTALKTRPQTAPVEFMAQVAGDTPAYQPDDHEYGKRGYSTGQSKLNHWSVKPPSTSQSRKRHDDGKLCRNLRHKGNQPIGRASEDREVRRGPQCVPGFSRVDPLQIGKPP